MKRKQIILLLIVGLIVTSMGWLFLQLRADQDLSTLSGASLVDELTSRTEVTSEELNDFQQRGEWEAVIYSLTHDLVEPTIEQLDFALSEGTPDVLEAYLQSDIDPFQSIDNVPVLASLFNGNEDPAYWKVVVAQLKDERLLTYAVEGLNYEATELLLNEGYTIQDTESVLLQPVRHNQVELTQLLLDNGAQWTKEMEQTAKDYNSDLILKMGN
ncbi:hypothetical protein M3591_09490 [Exiguobacterium sp. MER 193]|uniref:hypothetical protein n=1 Tax=Exiguobacterium TaxID=33986 RepID=UPI00203FFB5C|nr:MULTISPECIES: hypothetical protein [Exiguobacterium]MCM3280765.1 hypothetical protein [Exiguobacterium sp. MER 193]